MPPPLRNGQSSDLLAPPNTIAALRRDMERLKIIKEQIKAIEQTRLQQFE